MAKPIIQTNGLRKVYHIGDQRVIALNRIDINIYEGEICCLLGTSGSGKSTLLNMLAGLEKPTKGEIIIEQTHVESLSEKQLADFRQKNVGFVFQSYNLLPSMTALENVSMPLLFTGVSKKLRNKRAKQMLKSVGLEKHISHRPPQMSGGQQQRVGIARAFVALPKIVFCDEPTGNLDSKTTVEVMAIIIKLAKKNNQTLVIVTHDPSIASYADRIIHILDGNVESIEENESPTAPVVSEEKIKEDFDNAKAVLSVAKDSKDKAAEDKKELNINDKPALTKAQKESKKQEPTKINGKGVLFSSHKSDKHKRGIKK